MVVYDAGINSTMYKQLLFSIHKHVIGRWVIVVSIQLVVHDLVDTSSNKETILQDFPEIQKRIFLISPQKIEETCVSSNFEAHDSLLSATEILETNAWEFLAK